MADSDYKMDDVPPVEDEEMDYEPLDLRKENNVRIRMLRKGASEDGSCASFQLDEEDHTLGNALRYIIMKNPQVDFCGYSMPHPSEDVMNIRIQTYGEISAKDALIKGFDDLIDLCDVVKDKFIDAKDTFGPKTA